MNDESLPLLLSPAPEPLELIDPIADPAPAPIKKKGGRPLGSKNVNTKYREAKAIGVMKELQKKIPDAFDGGAWDLLVCIYKDPEYPIELRLDAAKAACKYERPALQAIQATGPGGNPLIPAAAPIFNIQFVDSEPAAIDPPIELPLLEAPKDPQ